MKKRLRYIRDSLKKIKNGFEKKVALNIEFFSFCDYII